ncbi:MAG TPA: MauE/DoxX family redox-associated membrane protein [Puia sp.]
MNRKQIILETICLLFFVLFLYTGVSKILDIARIRVVMGSYPIIKPFSSWLSYAIISVEILVALLLLWPEKRLIALYICFGLMALFTIYVIIVLKTSDHLPCTCGGVIQKMSWNQHLFFNLFFLALALLGIILYDKQNDSTYLLQQ